MVREIIRDGKERRKDLQRLFLFLGWIVPGYVVCIFGWSTACDSVTPDTHTRGRQASMASEMMAHPVVAWLLPLVGRGAAAAATSSTLLCTTTTGLPVFCLAGILVAFGGAATAKYLSQTLSISRCFGYMKYTNFAQSKFFAFNYRCLKSYVHWQVITRSALLKRKIIFEVYLFFLAYTVSSSIILKMKMVSMSVWMNTRILQLYGTAYIA
jgi:hypothetical protein